ncbi:YaaC family protein [Peribacillus loiseleuriae]|uniref:YaaC family protein n=1 Tax=Peribacillus loiseleuriae TaxID=1679170 RepID=UPI003D08A7C9
MMNYPTIWDSLSNFYSASRTQIYLNKCYRSINDPTADKNSYENCYPFIYYLEHGQTYYTQAKIAPLSIQPVLMFYGFTQLLKACVLTSDPHYPENTGVLAHGVTTRKRKKQQYEFLQDEVKIQKNGLYMHVLDKVFGIKQIENERYTMKSLLTEIPELYESHHYLFGKKSYKTLQLHNNRYQLSPSILDTYQMTANRFKEHLESKTKLNISITESDLLEMEIDQKLLFNKHAPIRYHLFDKNFMLSLTKGSECSTLPEIMLHYLLLYNLSMICRYETEWWSELLKTMPNEDYPLILQFLSITQEKIPFLIYQWLTSERFSTQ